VCVRVVCLSCLSVCASACACVFLCVSVCTHVSVYMCDRTAWCVKRYTCAYMYRWVFLTFYLRTVSDIPSIYIYHIYICVYIYIYIFIYLYVYILHIYIHKCKYIYIYIHTNTCAYVRRWNVSDTPSIHIHVYFDCDIVSTYKCIDPSIYISMYAYICECIYRHSIYVHMHISINIYIYACINLWICTYVYLSICINRERQMDIYMYAYTL